MDLEYWGKVLNLPTGRSMSILKVFVSHGLPHQLTRADEDDYSQIHKAVEGPKEPLAYVLIIQCSNASEIRRVITQTNREGVVRLMLYKAVNGVPVVSLGLYSNPLSPRCSQKINSLRL